MSHFLENCLRQNSMTYLLTNLGYLVLDIHFVQDCGTIVGSGDFTVWTDQNFIHSVRAEGRFQRGTNSLSCQYMGFDRFDTA